MTEPNDGDVYRMEGDRLIAGPELPKPEPDRKFVSKIVIGWAVLGILFIAGLSMMFARPGSDRGASPSSPTAASPSPGSHTLPPGSEEGLEAAIVHVVATEPNPDRGIPRIEAMVSQFAALVGCNVTDITLETAPSRTRIEDMLPDAVFERIHYADVKLWAGVDVTISCPDR